MSGATLDSDLYGDIYGDEDLNEYSEQPEGGVQFLDEDTTVVEAEKHEVNTDTNSETGLEPEARTTAVSVADTHSSLPAKPSSTPNLSYSAQVAKQFSAYQQTPSQERQQRTEIPLPPNPRTNSSRSSYVVPITGPPVTTTSGGTVFGKKPSEMHDAGKMFIGGLNWDTTDEGLRDYFSQFGKVDACTIMRDPSGTSRGFAFLSFEDPLAVNIVVSREHLLDGKAIDPKRAIPREEHLRNTRYFVGGLSPTTTTDSMRAFFSSFGKVVDATVMLDRETGRGKGFGFVTFEDAVDDKAIVGKIGLILDEKEIEVKAAQPRSQRDQARTSSSPNLATSTGVALADASTDHSHRVMPSTGSMNNFMSQNQNQQQMFFGQGGMNQMPFGGMMGMGMNPMMGMGMGMGGFGMPGMGIGNMVGMGNMGMGGMGMGMMNGMEGMPNNTNHTAGVATGGMGVMRGGMTGGMRLGMGPIGNIGGGMGSGPGIGMGMGMGNNMLRGGAAQMGNMRGGMVGLSNGMGMGMGRIAGGAGSVGPSRSVTKGQHGFHPYAR